MRTTRNALAAGVKLKMSLCGQNENHTECAGGRREAESVVITLARNRVDMSASKEMVREKARVASDLIKRHPLMPELFSTVFEQKQISAFKFSDF